MTRRSSRQGAQPAPNKADRLASRWKATDGYLRHVKSSVRAAGALTDQATKSLSVSHDDPPLATSSSSDRVVTLLPAAFDAIDDPIAVMDCKQTIDLCNKSMASFLGLAPGEIVGHHCYELVHGESKRPKNCPLARVRQSRRRETEVLSVGNRW